MMEERVKIISSELLKPANNSSNPPKFKLTVFDRLVRHVPYQHRVLFYRASPFEDVVKLLKHSLEKVLVVFYPFAGRIRVGDGVSSPVLELDCGLGQSVMFTQAVTDVTLEQLGCFEPSDFCDSLCGIGFSPPKYPWSPQDPLLFVQVTKFGCGGISLGFAFSHQVSDGVSAWHFMNSWAEVATTGSVKVAPDITYRYEELEITKEQAENTKLDIPVLKSEPVAENLENLENLRLVTRKYILDREMIEKLRAEAAATTNGTRFSTFVLVSAYLWKKITVARQLPESTQTRYLVVVNTRGRLAPFSKSYFGNAASGVFATAAAGEIERSDIGKCAAILHAKIAGWKEEVSDIMLFTYDWIQTNNPRKFSRQDSNTLQPIGSPRHPVYETDFGFGKPVGVTFGTNSLQDGNIYMFPTPEGDGSVSATVVLKSDDMERLAKQDTP